MGAILSTMRYGFDMVGLLASTVANRNSPSKQSQASSLEKEPASCSLSSTLSSSSSSLLPPAQVNDDQLRQESLHNSHASGNTDSASMLAHVDSQQQLQSSVLTDSPIKLTDNTEQSQQQNITHDEQLSHTTTTSLSTIETQTSISKRALVDSDSELLLTSSVLTSNSNLVGADGDSSGDVLARAQVQSIPVGQSIDDSADLAAAEQLKSGNIESIAEAIVEDEKPAAPTSDESKVLAENGNKDAPVNVSAEAITEADAVAEAIAAAKVAAIAVVEAEAKAFVEAEAKALVEAEAKSDVEAKANVIEAKDDDAKADANGSAEADAEAAAKAAEAAAAVALGQAQHLEQAVIKIQALVRGHLARKAMPPTANSPSSPTPAQKNQQQQLPSAPSPTLETAAPATTATTTTTTTTTTIPDTTTTTTTTSDVEDTNVSSEAEDEVTNSAETSTPQLQDELEDDENENATETTTDAATTTTLGTDAEHPVQEQQTQLENNKTPLQQQQQNQGNNNNRKNKNKKRNKK